MFPNQYGFTSSFWKSLGHTSGILNNVYGRAERHIISHSPYLLDRQILADMNDKLKGALAITLRQKFRTDKSFQFTMGYYQFIRAEQTTAQSSLFFKELDTNCDKFLDFGES